MATKVVDAAAAKQRQQKIILIVGAVLLVGVMAIQGPKLLKHGSSSTAAPAAATANPTADGATPTTGTATPAIVSPTTVTVVAGKGSQSAQVAGVVIRTAGPPVAGAGQLWSLSRFKVKDPFIQQASDSSGSGAGTASGATTATVTKGGATGAVVTPSTSTPVALGYATLIVNGKPQQLALKQVFPKGQPTFVLQAVGKDFVKVGVAGGKFTGGAAVKLDLGEKVTLMNTATGQRFVMKLVYTGDQPEQIAGYKAPGTAPATTTSPPALTTTATPGAPGATS